MLADEGLIEIEGNQKVRRLNLTEKGKKVAESILAIRTEMNRSGVR